MGDLTSDELTFLQNALDLARYGDTSTLAELIDAGLPVNLTNGAGDTLLILAAYHQHPDTVQMLLNRGADHARINDRGQGALAAAVFRSCEAAVRALLAAGADPDLGQTSARAVAGFFGLQDMQALLPGSPATSPEDSRDPADGAAH